VFAYYGEYGVFVDDAQTAQNTAVDELNISYTTFTDNTSGDYSSNPVFSWSANGCGLTMAQWLESPGSLCFDLGNQFDPLDPAYDASFCGVYCNPQFAPNFVLDDVNTELDPPDYSSLSGFFTP